MTKQELVAAKKEMILTAEYLQTTISRAQLELYINDLKELELCDFIRALKEIRSTTKIVDNKFPLPATIKEKCGNYSQLRELLKIQDMYGN